MPLICKIFNYNLIINKIIFKYYFNRIYNTIKFTFLKYNIKNS